MSSRPSVLRQQIAVYRRALQQVENLELWERYEKLLEDALRELEVLEGSNLPTALPETPIERLRKLVKSGGTGAATSRTIQTRRPS